MFAQAAVLHDHGGAQHGGVQLVAVDAAPPGRKYQVVTIRAAALSDPDEFLDMLYLGGQNVFILTWGEYRHHDFPVSTGYRLKRDEDAAQQ